jgi:hypothetical protein
MTYATPSDIRETLAPDGNTTGTAAELSDEQLQRHLERGQELVDGMVGTVYPDDSAPMLLAGLVMALGSYYATLAYRKGKDLSQFDPVYLMYQDARQTLKDIKTGDVNPTPEASAQETGPFVRSKPSVKNPMGDVRLFTLRDSHLVVRTGRPRPYDEGPFLDTEGP